MKDDKIQRAREMIARGCRPGYVASLFGLRVEDVATAREPQREKSPKRDAAQPSRTARAVGVDVSGVWRACKIGGVRMHRRGRPLSTDGVPVVAARMVANGASYYSTAQALGVDVVSVVSACKRRGVRSRHSGGGKRNEGSVSALAARMVANGASMTAAARECGIAVPTVYAACKARGIKSRYRFPNGSAEKRA